MVRRRKGKPRTVKGLLEQLAVCKVREQRWFGRLRRALTGMQTERATWERIFKRIETLRAEQAAKRKAKRAAVHQEEEE